MSKADMFALRNSGLEAFLFAEVGTELNGSRLTMLSVLARLGQDPWDAAARWAGLPKAAIVDPLMLCLSSMPLGPRTQIEARATAMRLVQLLPAVVHVPPGGDATPDLSMDTMPKWLPAVLIAGLVFGAAISLTRLPPPADTAAQMSRTVVASPRVP